MGAPSIQKANPDGGLGPRLPLRLGRFTLCEELGAGGMATVYLARMDMAAGIERLVALKTIHPHLAKERPFVDMFLDEARIASHVGHPNVCSTHDFGEVDGVYYLAMEYLLGEPLFDVINRMVERFEDAEEVLPYLAARIVADAAEGIHAAHTARGPDGEELSIVHRDVSPQNLFLTYDGSVKVVDFGCAKAAERVAHTSTGVMKGKVGYAAPEQLKNDAVDHRADIWALGVCLWETLTLSPLFSRDTAVKTAMAVLDDEIELASDGREWVPDRVAQIAHKALSRDRDARYDSARQLSRELRKFIADGGFTLESAELAEWMDFLFEERRAERADTAKRVQEMDLSDVSTAPLYEVQPHDIEMLDGAHDALPVVEDEVTTIAAQSGRVARSESAPRERASERRGGSRGWMIALGVLVVLGVGGFYAQLYYEPAPWVYELFGLEAPAAVEEELTTVGGGEAVDPEAAQADPEAEAETAAEAETETVEGDEAETEGETEGGAETETEGEAEGGAETETAGEPAGRRGRRGGGGGVTTVVSGGSSAASASASETPTRTGVIEIRASSGFATIYVGGRRLGQTPLRTELPVGRHRLRILPYGHEPAEVRVVHVEPALEVSLTIDVDDPTAGR